MALIIRSPDSQNDFSGRTISIVFAVVAFVVVFCCILWGILLPKIRARRRHLVSNSHNAARVSDHQLQASVQLFPGHPAIMCRRDKHVLAQPRYYNPRTQTPFPSMPPNTSLLSLPSITNFPFLKSASDISFDSHGLFTPIKASHTEKNTGTATRENRDNHNFGLSWSLEDGSGQGQSEERYIQDVCQPRMMAAKTAGRAPPLTKQLEKFPIPSSSTTQSNKVAHPNKLFKELKYYGGTISKLPVDTSSPRAHRSLSGHRSCQSLSAALDLTHHNLEKNNRNQMQHKLYRTSTNDPSQAQRSVDTVSLGLSVPGIRSSCPTIMPPSDLIRQSQTVPMHVTQELRSISRGRTAFETHMALLGRDEK